MSLIILQLQVQLFLIYCWVRVVLMARLTDTSMFWGVGLLLRFASYKDCLSFLMLICEDVKMKIQSI